MAQVEEDKLFEGAGLGERARAWGRERAIFFNDDSDMQPCGVELHDNSFCHSFRNFNISLDGPGWAGGGCCSEVTTHNCD